MFPAQIKKTRFTFSFKCSFVFVNLIKVAGSIQMQITLSECLFDQGVEAVASHLGGVGPGEVEHHPPQPAHARPRPPV